MYKKQQQQQQQNWTALFQENIKQTWRLLNWQTQKTEQHFYDATQNRHEHY